MATNLQCSVLGFHHRPIPTLYTPPFSSLNLSLLPNAPPYHFTLRSKNNVRFLLRRSLHSVCASKGSSSEGSNNVSKSIEDAKGPPFLTILAGFLVFFAVFWLVGSIVMWLFGLFFHLPPSK